MGLGRTPSIHREKFQVIIMNLVLEATLNFPNLSTLGLLLLCRYRCDLFALSFHLIVFASSSLYEILQKPDTAHVDIVCLPLSFNYHHL